MKKYILFLIILICGSIIADNAFAGPQLRLFVRNATHCSYKCHVKYGSPCNGNYNDDIFDCPANTTTEEDIPVQDLTYVYVAIVKFYDGSNTPVAYLSDWSCTGYGTSDALYNCNSGSNFTATLVNVYYNLPDYRDYSYHIY
ncbi:MAG: hypothetical protein NTW49_07730 [Bacteroidia bacterium]|nr:hypothetical protein [Bacteroidia bacterium]